MIELISRKIGKIKSNLFSLDDQPIGKAALTILIFLDVFILISIFDGLSDHTRQLAQPGQFIPQYCRDIVIDDDWNKTNQLALLAKIVTDSRNSYYVKDEKKARQKTHAICMPVTKILLAIENSDEISIKLKQLLKVKRETAQLNSQLKNINNAYDTSLLQDIAGQKSSRANVESIRKEVALQTNSLEKLTDMHHSLVLSINKDEKIQALFKFASTLSEVERTKLKNDLRQLNFWYPVKRLGMEMVFLLPLFLTFYFWNTRSICNRRPFQTLVSSHLLAVVFIPVIFKLMVLVYDIIPHKLLKNVIDFLESLKLVALWHYLMMAVFILMALALIYLFQKKLFSREKLIEKRISKGACQNCGKHLPVSTVICPFCGFEQFKKCNHCDKPTYVFAKFCKECGRSNEENV